MPREAKDLKSLARTHTAAAVKTLKGIMNQPKAPSAARVAAAVALMDRGWGKPGQTVAIAGDPDNPVTFNMRFGDGLPKPE